MTYHEGMNFYPTFCFRVLDEPLLLSKEFSLYLRPPSKEELPLWETNTRNIFGHLSDKEKRRILYALYPLGLPKASGTWDEIFVSHLSPLWLGLEVPDDFFLESKAYGVLCGFISAGGFMRNPMSFVAAFDDGNRLFLRALKSGIQECADFISGRKSRGSLEQLQAYSLALDSFLAQKDLRDLFKKLGRVLSTSTKTQAEDFFRLVTALEGLLVNEGSSRSAQFAHKLALIRHLALKSQGESCLHPPSETERVFREAYRMRSLLAHGEKAPSAQKLALYSNMLFSTFRLSLQFMVDDPLLFFYLKDS